MENYEGLFLKNNEGKYCTFLDIEGSFGKRYYEVLVCLENCGPKQNFSGRKFSSLDEISKGEFSRIDNNNSKKEIINFMEKRKEGDKYKLFWKEFEEIRF